MLGYGPRPWYALFLPSGGDNLVRIEAIEADVETQPTAAADTIAPTPPKPKVETQPAPEPEPEPAPQPAVIETVVKEPVVEASPEPAPPEPVGEPAAESVEAKPEQAVREPVAEETVAEASTPPEVAAPTPASEKETEVDSKLSPSLEEEENELEDYLAGRREEPTESSNAMPEVASLDDIEAMFASAGATQDDADLETAPAKLASKDSDEEIDDRPLDQDDIAALFK